MTNPNWIRDSSSTVGSVIAARLSARAWRPQQLRKRTTALQAKAAFVKGGCRKSYTAAPSGPKTDPQEHLSRGVPLCGPPALRFPACFCCPVSPGVAACGKKEAPPPSAPQNSSSLHSPRRPGRHRRLAGLHRARRNRQGLRLGDAVREGHRLQGQREDRRHLGRDGVADEPGRLRPGDRVRRRVAAADPRRHRAAGRHLARAELRRTSTAPARKRRGTSSTASITACLTSGDRTCSCTTPRCSRRRRRRGSVVFEAQKLPDGKPNKGRVQAYDGPIYIADAALYLMTKKPELGIKDPYELNEAQYTAALDVLRKQHPLIQRYWHDANVQVQDFTNEGVVASSSWPFQVNTLIANKQPIASTVPAEGATGWADTTMLARERQASELRVQVAGVVAHAEGAGRRRRLVRLGAGRARGLRKATRCSAPRVARPTASTTSTRSSSGARRKPSARRRARLRAVQPLGDGLRRRDGRPVARRPGARAPAGADAA